MTNGELVKMLETTVNDYRSGGVLRSVARNAHMNDYSGAQIEQRDIDAILVDLLNFIAARRCCMDLGLYTKDLPELAEAT